MRVTGLFAPTTSTRLICKRTFSALVMRGEVQPSKRSAQSPPCEDEAAPRGGFRQLLPQIEDLPARHQGRQPPQFVQRPLQCGGVGVLRLLQDGALAPGIRRPFSDHEFSS